MMYPERTPIHPPYSPPSLRLPPLERKGSPPLIKMSSTKTLPMQKMLLEMMIERGDIDEEGSIREESPFYSMKPSAIPGDEIRHWISALSPIQLGRKKCRLDELIFALHSLFPGSVFLYGGSNPITDSYLIKETEKILPEPSPFRTCLFQGIQKRKKSSNDIDLMIHLPHHTINCDLRARQRRKAANQVKTCLNKLFEAHLDFKERHLHNDSGTFLDIGEIDIMINHLELPVCDSPSNALFLSFSEYFEQDKMHPIFFDKLVFGEWLLHNAGKIYTLLFLRNEDYPHPTLLKRMVQFRTLGFSIMQKEASENVISCFLTIYQNLPEEKFFNTFEKHLSDHFSTPLSKEAYLINLLILINDHFPDKDRFFPSILKLAAKLGTPLFPLLIHIGDDKDKIEPTLLFLKLIGYLALNGKKKSEVFPFSKFDICSSKKDKGLEIEWRLTPPAANPSVLFFHVSPKEIIQQLFSLIKSTPTVFDDLAPTLKFLLFRAVIQRIISHRKSSMSPYFEKLTLDDPPFLHLLCLVCCTDPVERVFSIPSALHCLDTVQQKKELVQALFINLGPDFKPIQQRLLPLVSFEIDSPTRLYAAIFLSLSKIDPYTQKCYQLFQTSPYSTDLNEGVKSKIWDSFFIGWVESGSKYGLVQTEKRLNKERLSPWHLLDLIFSRIKKADHSLVDFLTLISSSFWARKDEISCDQLISYHIHLQEMSLRNGISSFSNFFMEVLFDKNLLKEAFVWMAYLSLDEIGEGEKKRTKHTLETLFLTFLEQQDYKKGLSVLEKLLGLGLQIDSELDAYWKTIRGNFPKKISKSFSIITLYLFNQIAIHDSWPKSCPLPELALITKQTPSQKGKTKWYSFLHKHKKKFSEKNLPLLIKARETVFQQKNSNSLAFALENGFFKKAAEMILQEDLSYDDPDQLISHLVAPKSKKKEWELAFQLIKKFFPEDVSTFYFRLNKVRSVPRLIFSWKHILQFTQVFNEEQLFLVLNDLKRLTNELNPPLKKLSVIRNSLIKNFQKCQSTPTTFEAALSLVLFFRTKKLFIKDREVWESILHTCFEENRLSLDIIECAIDSGVPLESIPIDIEELVEECTKAVEMERDERALEEPVNSLAFVLMFWLEIGVPEEKSMRWIQSFGIVLRYFHEEFNQEELFSLISSSIKNKSLPPEHLRQILVLPLYAILNELMMVDEGEPEKREFFSSFLCSIVIKFFNEVLPILKKHPHLKIHIPPRLLSEDYFLEAIKILPQAMDLPTLVNRENTLYINEKSPATLYCLMQRFLAEAWSDLLTIFDQLNDRDAINATPYLYSMIAQEEFLWDNETHPYIAIKTGSFYRLFLKNNAITHEKVENGIRVVIQSIWRTSKISESTVTQKRLQDLGSWYWALIEHKPIKINVDYHREMLDAYNSQIENVYTRQIDFLNTLEHSSEIERLKKAIVPSSKIGLFLDTIARDPELYSQCYSLFACVSMVVFAIWFSYTKCGNSDE